MAQALERVVAVDWSGDVRAEHGVHEKLWVAEVVDGELVSLDPSSRQGVVDRLRRLAAHDPALVVGLDFSFSLPAWFLDTRAIASAEELWHGVSALPTGEPPFYGWAGSGAPEPARRFRRTEEAARAQGLPVKSTFLLRGPGSVGTGSLRGMGRLAELAADGFAVWPFSGDPGGRPVVAEVYPRAFLPDVIKSRPADRARAWDRRWPEAGSRLREVIVGREDAFDAAVAALGLAAGLADRCSFPRPDPTADPREGWIAFWRQ